MLSKLVTPMVSLRIICQVVFAFGVHHVTFELGVVPLPVEGGIGVSGSFFSLSFVPRPTPRPIAKPMTITAAQQMAIILRREQVLFPFISVQILSKALKSYPQFAVIYNWTGM